MAELFEAVFRGLFVVGGRYIDWSAVLEWVAVVLYFLFWIGGALLAAFVVYKLVSYPLKQMKRRNDLLEQMLREMKTKQ
ncbi:hypothetical protein [Pseudescherichia sp.]|uniref:hypothetical protein n=1 Tax=Pseudescherichia sp. TaxID=2055881 RepID=UPI00289B948D|nr:hypothetical protein [Pseudescherichia sp.]